MNDVPMWSEVLEYRKQAESILLQRGEIKREDDGFYPNSDVEKIAELGNELMQSNSARKQRQEKAK